MTRNLVLAALCAALACKPSVQVSESVQVTAAEPQGHALSHTVVVSAEDPLVSYSWDGGPPVPAGFAPGEHRIAFGEAGADERTPLYVTFDEASRAAETTADGRFGRAGSLLEVANDPNVLTRPFVVSFWVRPEPEVRGHELVIFQAGPLSLRIKPGGRCSARLDGDPPMQLATGALRYGEWNHVALALDAPRFPQMRLVVNEQFATAKVETETAFGTGDRLRFGSESGCAIDDVAVRDYPTSTTDLLDRWLRGASSGEHVLRLVYGDRTEEVSTWAGVIDEPVIATGERWAEGALRHAVSGADGLRRVPGHWERIPTRFPPVARTTHPTVYVGDHQIFVFGGETRDTHGWVWGNTNDTWIFHTDTGRWEEVPADAKPEPSCHQPAAYSPDHDLILYPGGWRNDCDPYVHYTDTWVFHVAERRWERRDPRGTFPAVSNVGLVYVPTAKRFVAFIPGHTRVMLYEPDADRWTRLGPWEAVSESGEPVEYKLYGSPMVGYDPASGLIVYFGGGTGANELVYSDKTALFDPERNRFTVLDTDAAPSPRVRSGFAYDSKRGYFVLFGGVQDHASQRNDDLWVFDPKAKSWRQAEASNPPSARGGYYGMAYDPDLDRFFLLCGRHSKELFLDDALSLHLDFSSEGEATYVFDQAAFPDRNEWFADTSTPGDSRVSIRFRTSPDLTTWTPWIERPGEIGGGRYVQAEVRLIPGQDGAEPTIARMGFR